MSAILDFAAQRRAVAQLCEALGLADLAAELRTKRADMPGCSLEMLRRVLLSAGAIRAAATHAHRADPRLPVSDPALGSMLAGAIVLEREALAAATACERVLEERDAENAKGCAPGLKPSARHYGGFR